MYLTILTVCKKNLNQSDHTDCKIITIEGIEKVILVGCPHSCQCFEIQHKLGEYTYKVPKYKNGKVM
jgi:hypothetical protein